MTDPDPRALDHLVRVVQDGVVTRRQLHAAGVRPHDLQRMLRRRDLVRVHSGVFLDHTGPPTRRQREWIAVLATGGALTRWSAMPRSSAGGPVHVAVDARRTVAAPPGVVVHRTAHLAERVLPASAPPRVRIEHAAVDLADDAPDEGEAFTLLADALFGRLTTPGALRAAVGARRRLGRRAFLLGAIADLEAGACSVLEQAYLHQVERAHHLPPGHRQVREVLRGVVVRRDVEYVAWGAVVELDGRTHHDSPRARDRDLRRDLALAAERDVRTVRLGHAQVLGDPCGVAADVGILLGRGGWGGSLGRCPRCPTVR